MKVLDRRELDRLPRTSLGKRSGLKPSVWLVETAQGPLVVKDAGHMGTSLRWLGRWLVSRERRILALLSEVDGIPRLVGQIDDDAIALSLVPGEPLDARSFRQQPREIVDQLSALTEKLHARGVFHLDLHQRRNVLIDASGRLHLVDFGAAVAPGGLARFFFGGILRYADRQAACKYLARFAPEHLSETEAHAIVRYERLRWLWPFTPHGGRRERAAARARLR